MRIAGKRVLWAVALALPWWGIVSASLGWLLPEAWAKWWGTYAVYPSFVPLVFVVYWLLTLHERELERRARAISGGA